MTIEEIKTEMMKYSDIFGGKLSHEAIYESNDIAELERVIDLHGDFLDDCVSDAKTGLSELKQRLGLTKYPSA